MTGQFSPARRSAAPILGGRTVQTDALVPLLAVAVALGLLLRVLGLSWGLPGPARSYPYHPDEPLLAMAALRVDFGALQLSPRFFNYGSLPIYLDRLAVNAAARAGWARLTPRTQAEYPLMVGDVIRVGRWITVLMGVLTVLATGVLGARLFGRRVGALAGLLLALAPLHLAQGHYCTVDVPAGLWTTLCLLLCAGALRVPDRGALALAGVCAGLAASTRYNAGIVLLAPLYTLAVTWRRPEWYASDRAAAVIYTPLAAAAAFLLTTPGIMIDSGTFWRNVSYEWLHSATGHGLVFVRTPPAWLYHLTRSLPDGIGVPLTLAVAAGLFWALARHTPEDGLLLIFVLVFSLMIGGAQIKFARYLVPILPALMILAARLLAGEEREVANSEPGPDSPRASDPGPERRAVRAFRGLALTVVVLWTGCCGVAMAAVFARPDPRDQAAAWISRVLQPGERVGLAGEPWFYTPPLTPSLGCTHVLERVCGEALPGWIIAPGRGEGALSVERLERARPEYVIISEFEYADPLRLRARDGYTDGVTALMDALQSRYRLAHVFQNRPSLGPLRWFTGRPPVHDLLYPMPDVRVYQRATR